MSPAELGYTGGLFKMFGGSKNDAKPFTAEPPRQSLTEPPPGYQTPSSSYAYGTGERISRGGPISTSGRVRKRSNRLLARRTQAWTRRNRPV